MQERLAKRKRETPKQQHQLAPPPVIPKVPIEYGEEMATSRNNNRFAVTCARMRQFMMMEENRQRLRIVGSSFQQPVQLPLVATGTVATKIDAKPLPLFPVCTGTEIFRPQKEAEATLTIFYQGQVATFHNFPADRAKELMQMAGLVTPEKVVTTAMPEKAETTDDPLSRAEMSPIARKLTLERFLRKRKHRMGGTDDPDHNEDALPMKKRDSAGSNPAEDMPEDASSWLKL